MNLSRIRALGACAVALCSTFLPGASAASAYPSGPVTIVVPYSHGGVTDLYARQLADVLSKRWKQSVIVDNRAGAGTLIGTQAVARAKPDGQTLLFTSYAYTSNPVLRKTMPYGPGDLAPVMLLSNSRNILMVGGNSELKTLEDIIAKAKQSPGNLTLASSGNASSPHIAAELWAQAAGVKITHVPYKGTAPAMNDIFGGQVDGIFDGPSSMGHVESGRLRAIAISSEQRSPLAPNVPTFRELGMDLVFGSWFGLFVPAATPADIQNQLNADLQASLADPQLRGAIEKLGHFIAGGTPQDFSQFLDAETRRLQQLISGGTDIAVE